jgi:6-pyruvoyltetrahydropterin/6-carboxytetrahydropterin synthase
MSTRVRLTRRYEFAAAHRLNGLSPTHKCSRLHGHNYALEVTVSATDLANGFVIDAGDLDICITPVLARIDHRCLNELDLGDPAAVAMASQPTAENIARYFWVALQYLGRDERQSLESVRVYENPRLWAEVRRE